MEFVLPVFALVVAVGVLVRQEILFAGDRKVAREYSALMARDLERMKRSSHRLIRSTGNPCTISECPVCEELA